MFSITKEVRFSAAHHLVLPYNSPCGRLHGHEWVVYITIEGSRLNDSGMLLDFAFISKAIKDRYDHKLLNDVIPQPTAELIALDIFQVVSDLILKESYIGLTLPLPICEKVRVFESVGSEAVYENV